MIYDVIYSFPVLIEKLVFINSFKGYYILILQLILGNWSFIFVANDLQMSVCVCVLIWWKVLRLNTPRFLVLDKNKGLTVSKLHF